MFYLVVLALVAALYGAVSRAGMMGSTMTEDHRLFIAIACYAVSAVLFRPLLRFIASYVIRVATGLPNIRHSKPLLTGFAVATLGLSVAAWSSHADESDSPGNTPQTSKNTPTPKNGGVVNSPREKNHG